MFYGLRYVTPMFQLKKLFNMSIDSEIDRKWFVGTYLKGAICCLFQHTVPPETELKHDKCIKRYTRFRKQP
jgi:hypothetical protein